MAATIARAYGHDKTRTKSTTRLGSQSSSVEAATWRTFAYATVDRNGAGYVQVVRDGQILHRFEFGAEG